MEELKIEIRSLLLSAKHGIPLRDIQKDYEDLILKPLNFRKFNFNNICELMQSMPDVARSTRDELGEIVFHAISDATTHHIKKMVSCQNSKKKRPSRGGRGRGGRGRGSRGGRGHFRGGGHITGGGHFRGSSHFRGGSHFSARGSPGFAGRVFSRGIQPFGGLEELERHPQRSQVGFFGDFESHPNFNELGNENVNPSGGFNSSPLRNLQIKVSPRGSRLIQTEDNGPVRPKPGDHREYLRDKASNRNAMNINESGHSFHQDNLLFGKIHQNHNENHHERYKNELAPRFQRQRQNSGNKTQYQPELPSINGQENVSQDVRYKSSSLPQAAKPTTFISQDTKPPSVTQPVKTSPQYIEEKVSQDVRYKSSSLPQVAKPTTFISQDTKPPTVTQPVKTSPQYIEEKDQNWEPPEDGEEYMKAFLHFFKSRGERPPCFEIIDGKVSKQKGFYGRLRHGEKLYYPLVIQKTKELAEMCAARMFCRENNIQLLPSSVEEKERQPSYSSPASQKSTVQSSSSTTPFSSSKSQPANSTAQITNSTVQTPKNMSPLLSSTPESPLSTIQQNGNSVAQSEKVATPGSDKEHIYKIYKILKETGIFIQALPAMYKESYQEELSLDLSTELEKWPDLFKLESIIKRIIVYPVPGALEKAAVPPTTEQPNKTEAAQVVTPSKIPPSPRQKSGRVLDCTICFYISPEEFYLHKSKVEKSLQEIEELLNEICPTAAVPEIQSLTVNSIVVGQYQGGWYRAEVKEVQPDKMKVFYIDYGNSESVQLKDLRCLPSSELIVNTPALAIKCALRKPPGFVGWCPDVDKQMEALMLLGVLKSRVIEHKEGLCMVELYHTSGFCINESISVAGKQSKDVEPSPRKLDPIDAGTLKPEMPKAQVMTTNNGLKSESGTPAAGNAATSGLSAGVTPVPATQVPLQVTQPTPVVLTHETSLGSARTTATPVRARQVPLQVALPTPGGLTHEASLSPAKTMQSPAALKPKEKNASLFPDPLVLPDTEEIAVYICDVLSECSVLLRIVDTEYSDKLDKLENDIADKFDSWPEPKEVRLGCIYAAAVDVDPEEFDEEGEEEEWEDCKRYHRVRVIQKQKGKYYCYFPDHGDFDHLKISDLREMDTKLSVSLPYQAIVAKLKGLDAVQSKHKDFAKRTLKKLVFIDQHSFAAVVTDKYPTDTMDADPGKLGRIMKIISCMNTVELDKVEQIYKDIYKEPCGGMEALFQHIPGFSYWKECMEIELYDTEQDDEDVYINTVIQDAVNEVVEGKDALEVFNSLFGTAYGSFAELDAEESDPDEVEEERVAGDGKAEQACKGEVSERSLPGKTLYTWNTDQPPNSPSAVLSEKSLYRYWSYPLLKTVPVYVISVESPSNFVAIPAEFQNEFETSQATLNQALSQSAVSAASLEIDGLYAVKIENKFYRAFYRQAIQQTCKVFLPDLCQYEIVSPFQLFVLPEQFAKIPFFANNMCIGDDEGVKPIGMSWDKNVKDWFDQNVNRKVLYAVVEKEKPFQAGLPPKLMVQLIDTNYGEDDLILAEHMIQTNMAAKE